MNTTYGFNWKKRLRGAAWPLGIALALGALLAAYGTVGTWRFYLLLSLIAVTLLRASGYLYWASRAVKLDATGITRSGKTVPFHSAELELRTTERGGLLHITELVLWGTRDGDGKREGVGFDDSLERFEDAVRAIVARMPESRVVVSAVGEPNLSDPRREEVLAKLRPSAAERALQELGRAALSVPPHLRN